VKAKIAKKNKKAKQIKKRIQQKQLKAKKIQKAKIQKQKKQVAKKQAKTITTSTAPSTPVTKKISTQDMECNCNCVPKQQAKKLAQIDSSPITAEFLSDSFHGDNALF